MGDVAFNKSVTGVDTELGGKEPIEYGILPAFEYDSLFMSVYRKFYPYLKYSILDKDDILNICRFTHYTITPKYIQKVKEGYAGSFESYLYTSCMRKVREEVNINKVGLRVTKYAVEQSLKGTESHSKDTLPVMCFSDLTSVETGFSSPSPLNSIVSLDSSNQNEELQASLEDIETEEDLTKTLIKSLVKLVDNELEQKLLYLKYYNYSNQEIASTLGVSSKYVSKKWISLKDKLKKRVLEREIDL